MAETQKAKYFSTKFRLSTFRGDDKSKYLVKVEGWPGSARECNIVSFLECVLCFKTPHSLLVCKLAFHIECIVVESRKINTPSRICEAVSHKIGHVMHAKDCHMRRTLGFSNFATIAKSTQFIDLRI